MIKRDEHLDPERVEELERFLGEFKDISNFP